MSMPHQSPSPCTHGDKQSLCTTVMDVSFFCIVVHVWDVQLYGTRASYHIPFLPEPFWAFFVCFHRSLFSANEVVVPNKSGHNCFDLHTKETTKQTLLSFKSLHTGNDDRQDWPHQSFQCGFSKPFHYKHTCTYYQNSTLPLF